MEHSTLKHLLFQYFNIMVTPFTLKYERIVNFGNLPTSRLVKRVILMLDLCWSVPNVGETQLPTLSPTEDFSCYKCTL